MWLGFNAAFESLHLLYNHTRVSATIISFYVQLNILDAYLPRCICCL